jgi:hypothetical protein
MNFLRKFGFPLAALFLLTAQTVAGQSFTLEQVMSSPFPSDPTVSKQGDKIAWVFNAEAIRSPACEFRLIVLSAIGSRASLRQLFQWKNGSRRCF